MKLRRWAVGAARGLRSAPATDAPAPGARAGLRPRTMLPAGLGLLLLALLPRLAFLAEWPANFDADEALFAFHGSRMLQGPPTLYLPGQDYMGTLPSLLAGLLQAPFGTHPTVARCATMLWILPGLFVCLALGRLGAGGLARGAGGARLALLWLLPPATLYFGGLKIREGHLPSLVLGLWAVYLAWPRAEARPAGAGSGRDARRRALRLLAAGALFGLAAWTHEQALLLAPWMLLLALLARPRPLAALALLFAGFVAGHLPIWVPRAAAGWLGPPGASGIEGGLEPARLFDPASFALLPDFFAQALVAGCPFPAQARWEHWALLLLSGAACLFTLIRVARHPRAAFDRHPFVVLSLYLAVANALAYVALPWAAEDAARYRYALFLSPLLIAAPLHALAHFPRRLAAAGLVVLVGLSLAAYARAVPGWHFPQERQREALVRHLEAEGIERVITDWNLAYFIMQRTDGRILCSSATPVRYPEINLAVALSPRACFAGLLPAEGAPPQAGEATAVAGAFLVRPRLQSPPEELSAAFAEIDPSRMLVADFEPWPLLPRGSFPRDWRGWPFARPLDRFEAIVWRPASASLDSARRGQVARALEELCARGAFRLVASGAGVEIYRREGAAAQARRGDR